MDASIQQHSWDGRVYTKHLRIYNDAACMPNGVASARWWCCKSTVVVVVVQTLGP